MTRGLWCSQCGQPAEPLGPSMDPDHPLVLCRWYSTEGYPRGHGRTIGVTDSAELSEVLAHHRALAERRQHAEHLRNKLVAACRLCQELRSAQHVPA